MQRLSVRGIRYSILRAFAVVSARIMYYSCGFTDNYWQYLGR